ncbi:helix-turn-helix domain-containing protein [Candidatus Chrysopegis kryptomonas]|uniref:Transcriptional regulator, XRE family with cupin sensor n=1 Tax=Candidatus Chryseopegocella kryptomonas TaxID=1633643 RepID=A0A0P1MRZ9_9BACT|nr:helix-turn-helix transcriptional regulator [Candidatus Chrysopegis kryptomonas]CUS98741.1 transcriptional regulator, XRE family with cupin sensor [Candidatus Chrysopegis kryptomonas]
MKVLEQLEFDNEFLAQQLKLLRLSTDKTINEIAEATGYSQSYISLIESGKRNLNYKNLRRILLYGFGETISSFFTKILEEDTNQTYETKLYKTPLKLYSEDKNIIVEILIAADIAREIELVKISLSPGSTFEEDFRTDFRVYGTLLNGTAIIQNSGQNLKISTRESFVLKAKVNPALEQVDFKIINSSENQTELLLIFTPPVF